VFFRLLPFVEQIALFDKWNKAIDGQSGTNKDIAKASGGTPMSFITCPTTGVFVSKYGDTGYYPSHYVGISGAIRGAVPSISPPYARIPDSERKSSTPTSDWGYVAVNGAIIFGVKNFAAITDGTSNTFCFSEMAFEKERTNNGSSSIYRAWVRGANYNGGCILSFGAKTLRDQNKYLINDLERYSQSGATDGQLTNCNNTNPLQSYHGNGVNVALVDGSVRFLTQTINPSLVLLYGSAEDGETGELP
jgi:prepilin-type processing-associated H-X9-DG protein